MIAALETKDTVLLVLTKTVIMSLVGKHLQEAHLILNRHWVFSQHKLALSIKNCVVLQHYYVQ